MGVGYYKYSFNKLKNFDVRFGGTQSNQRPLNYPHITRPVFYTNNYWYNTISILIGANKVIRLNNDYEINIGPNIINYFTYFQVYTVTSNGLSPYKSKDFRYYGFSANLNFTITKNISDYYIGTQIIAPFFDLHKKDLIFKENMHDSRSKLFRGVGAGIVIGRWIQ